MLKKAIAYLVWYLLRKTPGPEAKIALSISRLAGEDRARLTVASRTAEVRAGGASRHLRPDPGRPGEPAWTSARA